MIGKENTKTRKSEEEVAIEESERLK